jgi:STE24 endopeptidase
MDGRAYAVFIGGALVLIFLVQRAADLLNLSRLQGDPPAEFREVFDGAAYAKSLSYTRARLRFSMASAAYGLTMTFLFWGLGGFALWDAWTRARGWGPTATGLLYIGGLCLALDLAGLPFDLYSTFVLEARFGFNRTTPRTFVLDKVKALLLGAVLGGALLALVLSFFTRLGSSAWLWAWGAATAFSLFLQFVAPTWIMPLFNKFTPLEEGELRTAIFALARRLDYPLTNVFVMDGSKRSSKTNAFFTGFGKNKRIALFDTLIKRHTVPELTAVMAHEIGHYKEGHVLLGTVTSCLQQGAMLFLLSLTLKEPGLFAAFGTALSVHAGLVLFGLLYAPASFLLGLGLTALSRRHEYQADRYAARVLEDPAPMADALKKLAATNLSQLTPHPFYVLLHYTHPPVPARLAALRRAAAR